MLSAHFTDVDGPVFAIRDLPEVVKGALFARYSRYGGSLRRLFLDEFADLAPTGARGHGGAAEARAAALYDRVFVGYGDDSVAQLGSVHLACEYQSNVLTKLLQRPRLAAYLEQSTRYIAYDAPMPGGRWRYYARDEWGDEWTTAMDALFGEYSALLAAATTSIERRFPQGDQAAGPWRRACRAKALDIVRGLLPAATLSHMGMMASGQTYEQLILRLLAHPLPEANETGAAMLVALREVIPSFLARVDVPERGGVWQGYLAGRRERIDATLSRLALPSPGPSTGVSRGPSVRLLAAHGSERELLAAELYEAADCDEGALLDALPDDPEAVGAMIATLVGERANRRHRPGRGFERLVYRFEVVSDYGAFRDLQRHRMCTVQWQTITPHLGAEVPVELGDWGLAERFTDALGIAHAQWNRLHAADPDSAQYAVCLASRMRYVIEMNAREAMHLIELRSGYEGHPAYRAVAHAMHDEIARVHPHVAAAMHHVDRTTEPRLERLMSEIRTEARRS